jgi:hypothetical protein
MAERKEGLYTVRGDGGPPTYEEAARQIGVSPDDIDHEFGIVALDPTLGLYSVRASVAAPPKQGPTPEGYVGPFSDPKIEPFGPLQYDKKK